MDHMKKLTALLTAAVMFSGTAAMAFSDTNGHWAESDINAMTAEGILNGYEDGSFKPDAPISRAEFLKIITTKYGLVEQDNAYVMWSDVSADDWYGRYSAAGLLLLQFDNAELRPEEPLMRCDAAYAILNIYSIDIDYESGSAAGMDDYAEFSDDSDIAAIVSTALDNGIMQGKGGSFEPYAPLTRAELCTLINRLESDADVSLINILLSSMIVPVDGQTGGNETAAEQTDGVLSALERTVFDLVNIERDKAGLEALEWDDELAAVARAHSEDMVSRGFFDHTDPDGLSPFDRMRNAGIDYTAAAENIAAGASTAEAVMQMWMNSDGHRANILDPDMKKIGVGAAQGGEYGIYWTQCFTD